MIKAVLLDFRDTLVDVSESYKAANRVIYRYLLSKGANLKNAEFSKMMKDIAEKAKNRLGKKTNIHNWTPFYLEGLLKSLKIKITKAEFDRLIKKYDEAFIKGVSLYPDSKQFLVAIKNKKMKAGVVIDGTSRRERKIIKRLHLAKHFNVISISEEVGYNKFTTKPLRNALDGLSVDSNEVMVIGDRLDKDIINANKLGCISVRLERTKGRYSGLKHVKKLEKPKYVIRNLNEAIKLINKK